jgi:hypothetical protein
MIAQARDADLYFVQAKMPSRLAITTGTAWATLPLLNQKQNKKNTLSL